NAYGYYSSAEIDSIHYLCSAAEQLGKISDPSAASRRLSEPIHVVREPHLRRDDTTHQRRPYKPRMSDWIKMNDINRYMYKNFQWTFGYYVTHRLYNEPLLQFFCVETDQWILPPFNAYRAICRLYESAIVPC